MSTRRARVRVVPKLVLGRPKPQPLPTIKPPVVVESENSENSDTDMSNITLAEEPSKSSYQAPISIVDHPEEEVAIIQPCESVKEAISNSPPLKEEISVKPVNQQFANTSSATEPAVSIATSPVVSSALVSVSTSVETSTASQLILAPSSSAPTSAVPKLNPSRRPRVKIAPKLTGRAKPKPLPVVKTPVIEESTDNSDVESSKPEREVSVSKPKVESISAPKEVSTPVEQPLNAPTTSDPPSNALETSAQKPDYESDWEDEEFTYNSLPVDQIPPELSDLITKATSPLEKDAAPSTPSSPASPMSPKPRLALGKSKFKPNLFPDRRSRNNSGSRPTLLSPRVRTISGGSGTDSDAETGGPRSPFSPRPLPSAPLLEGLLSHRGRPARVRRITETRSQEMVKKKSQFMTRKQEHKRRFLRGVPERGNMTMFDLIYYNPENGSRMSIEEEDNPPDEADVVAVEGAQVPEAPVEPNLVPPKSPTPPLDEEEGGVPCPQVKVGSNGEIILDDASLTLETTEAKKAKDFMMNIPDAVVETNKSQNTNYGTWSKKRRHVDWGERETLKFYRALSVVGSDFSMMESIFKKRTRQELKLKFKKEERQNGKMVDKCLKERGMYTELEGLMEDSEDSDEERGRRQKPKKKTRRRYKNKGYYDSSSDGEEADGESCSPARKKPREVIRNKRARQDQRAVLPADTARPATFTSTPQPRTAPTTAPSGAHPLSGVQFPPGLLAANPGLVGARPGSLVVVASPSKTDPGSQLLHVYMVSSRQKTEERQRQDRSRSPRVPTSPTQHRASSPGQSLTLDPAVVRAVDHTRLERKEGGGRGRSRAVSECEEQQGGGRKRQRTVSEGSSCNLHTDLVRQRFLESTAR